jgi:hypothetical protein
MMDAKICPLLAIAAKNPKQACDAEYCMFYRRLPKPMDMPDCSLAAIAQLTGPAIRNGLEDAGKAIAAAISART